MEEAIAKSRRGPEPPDPLRPGAGRAGPLSGRGSRAWPRPRAGRLRRGDARPAGQRPAGPRATRRPPRGPSRTRSPWPRRRLAATRRGPARAVAGRDGAGALAYLSEAARLTPETPRHSSTWAAPTRPGTSSTRRSRRTAGRPRWLPNSDLRALRARDGCWSSAAAARKAKQELAAYRELYERGLQPVRAAEARAGGAGAGLGGAQPRKREPAALARLHGAAGEPGSASWARPTALSRLGRHAEAVRVLERARTLAPEDVRIRTAAGAEQVPGSRGVISAMLLALARPPAGDCPVRFTDVAPRRQPGLHPRRGATPEHRLPETMGSGLAWLDYDRDGWMDLYVVQSGPFPPGRRARSAQDRLFRNRGDGTFEDVTAKAGLKDTAYGMGAFAADYDNDGFVDLYVTNWGGNILYRNEGDGTFADVTAKAGVAASALEHGRRLGRRRRRRPAGPLRRALRRRLARTRTSSAATRSAARRDYCPPIVYPGTVSTPVPQPRRRHLRRRHARGRPRPAPSGKGLGAVFLDVDAGRKARPLRRQRRGRELPLPQPRRRPLRGRLDRLGRRLRSARAIRRAAWAWTRATSTATACLDLVVANFEGETNEHYRNLGDGSLRGRLGRVGLRPAGTGASSASA